MNANIKAILNFINLELGDCIIEENLLLNLSDNSINVLINLIDNIQINENDITIEMYNLVGVIHHCRGNLDSAKKYYLLAIENKNEKALYNLGCLYDSDCLYISVDDHKSACEIVLAKKYYLLAIEKGIYQSIKKLAHIYRREGNTELAKKYYLLDIEKGNSKSINILARIYEREGNIELAKKYYLMSVEKCIAKNNDVCNTKPMYNLGNLFMEEKEYETAITYFTMAIKKSKNYKELYVKKLLECGSKINKIIFDALKNEQKIKELENKIQELTYMPGGVGYQAAKVHFDELSKN